MKRYIKSAVLPISDESYSTKIDIARNPHSRDSQLAALVETADPYLLSNLIFNPNASAATIIDVLKHYPEDIKDTDSYFHEICELLADVKYPEVIEYLRQDPVWEHPGIRFGAAKNFKTPVPILIELAKDEESAVRHQVASHPELPIDSLRELLDDLSPLTRSVAEKYYKLRGGE